MILDSIEDIRRARAAGHPIGDPAKLEKLIKAALTALDEKANETNARSIDVFMAVSNLARIIVKKTENHAWDKETRADYRKMFLDTLTKAMFRDLEKEGR